MPSLQQLRHEALADAVERATRPPLLLTLASVAAGPLDVRVEGLDGTSLEFRLLEVVLDGSEIWGRTPGGLVRVPLTNVRALWHHRRRTGRALLVWLATMLLCSGVGAAVATSTSVVEVAAGVLGGALIGAVAGIGTLLRADKWRALYEWVLLYDNAAASPAPEAGARVD